MGATPEQLRTLLERADALGHPDRNSAGREVDYWCPFCLKRGFDRQSHIHVNYLKNCAVCHQCGGWKDLTTLVKVLLGRLPRSLMRSEIGEELVDYVRTMMVRRRQEAEDMPGEEEAVKLPDEFVPFGGKLKDPIGRGVWQYLTGDREGDRNLPPEFLTDIGAGYCASGRHSGYAIFPVHVGGELVTFTSRRVFGTSSKVRHGDATKSRMAVFNYDAVAQQRARRVFIGEGPFDGWAFHRRADKNDGGVALLGKVLHDDQCRLLDRLPGCEELVMCLDDTEHEKTRAGAAKLAKLTGKRVSYILLEPGSGDPHKNRDRLPGYVAQRQGYDPFTSKIQAAFD